MASAETIANVLKEIMFAYPKFMEDEDARTDATKVWAVYLADIPDDLLVVAVRQFISSSSHAFAPSIPEIRSSVVKIKAEIEKIPSAFEAWDEVINARKPYVYYDGSVDDKNPHKWSHEIVGIVARRLGYPKRFPSDDVNDLVSDRSNFLKAYDYELSKLSQNEKRLPMIDSYIENEKLLIADKQSAFDTGEAKQVNDQIKKLAKGISVR